MPRTRNSVLAGTLFMAVATLIATATVAIPGVAPAAAVEGAPGARPMIAAGGAYACGLLASGTVECWGDNSTGQVGDGTNLNERHTATAVTGLTGITSIATGTAHSCAILVGNQVKCWGNNAKGQIGDNTNSNERDVPTVVTGLTTVTALAAGANHSCALLAAGTVKCWGDNTTGQVGDGTNLNERDVATAVTGLTNVTAIATGDDHSCALLATGTVKCWGNNAKGQIGDNTNLNERDVPTAVTGLTNVKAIEAGNQFTCALLATGTVKCWGNNGKGEIGDNSTTERDLPTAVTGLTNAQAIAAGGEHTCALLGAGTMSCWGDNANGEIGDNTIMERHLPTAVSGVPNARAIAAGATDTCAIMAGGTLKCWGDNAKGQIGDLTIMERHLPTTVTGVGTLTGSGAITAGSYHTCALVATGAAAVKCWGYNAVGQIGDKTTTKRLIPTSVYALSGVSAIAAGAFHTCALLATGTAKCWGDNSYGQLGDNTLTERHSPAAVVGLTNAIAITASQYDTCALLAAGTVKCWGDNFYGQVGDNTTTERHIPTTVTSLTGVIAISGGGYHVCALLAAGTEKCWGLNSNGQIGDNTHIGRHLAKAVTGLTNVSAVANGDFTSCALLAAGTVKCWGANDQGQIGDGTTTERLLPTAVGGALTGVASITGGTAHTCSRGAGGGLRCWGDNSQGQIGDNTITDRHLPTVVGSLTGLVFAITAGLLHTCALLGTSTLRCWGDNAQGQIGDGTITDRHLPHTVTGL